MAQRVMIARSGICLAVAVAVGGLVATTPASAQFMGPKEEIGTGTGALIGGIVGSFVGGGAGARVGAAVAGAVIGGVIGNRIGAALDEEDRRQAEAMTRATMSSASSRSYTNKRTGVRVKTRVTSTSKNASGQTCRTVQQEVVKPDGQVVTDTVKGCRGADGWKV